MSFFKIYLDDVRPMPEGYDVLVRNYDQFVNHIDTHGLPTEISFDHDLGEGLSGYDCAKWLVNYCLDRGICVPKWEIHSANPVGRENIHALLFGYMKHYYISKVVPE